MINLFIVYIFFVIYIISIEVEQDGQQCVYESPSFEVTN